MIFLVGFLEKTFAIRRSSAESSYLKILLVSAGCGAFVSLFVLIRNFFINKEHPFEVCTFCSKTVDADEDVISSVLLSDHYKIHNSTNDDGVTCNEYRKEVEFRQEKEIHVIRATISNRQSIIDSFFLTSEGVLLKYPFNNKSRRFLEDLLRKIELKRLPK